MTLEHHGLGDRVAELNPAAARVARAAAGDGNWVLGDVGPFGDFIEPLGDITAEELGAAFRVQMAALLDGGADAILLETLSDPAEAVVGVETAKACNSEVPVIVTYTFQKTTRMLGVGVGGLRHKIRYDVKSMKSNESSHSRSLAATVGLILAVLTILYGQGMGVVFGLNEDAIKSKLKTSAEQVRDTAYKGDEAAIKQVLDKSWSYMKRAHLHAGGMGTTAVVLIVLVNLLGTSRRLAAVIGAMLGAGGLGYSIFWMWAGFRAPGLASTGAAKESLSWLAMPSSGAFVLATIAVLGLLVLEMVRGRGDRGRRGEV